MIVNRIIDPEILFFLYSRWFSLPIGSEILVFFFFGILDGFGYPLVLNSWFSCCCLVFSMVLAIH